MENPKCILIISQYYYSHHCFVVSSEEENFREKALTLIEKLEDYKREGWDKRPYRYGTSRDDAYTDIRCRWNVNDAGDIYFIPCESATEALRESEDYNSELYRKQWCKGVKAARRKEVENSIDKHHLYGYISKLVSECFNVI